MKIAILDDYADVATRLADWSGLGEVTAFNDHIADQGALVERLKPFDIVCVMRERTPLPARVIDALPALKLIVTTGSRNASIDLEAAKARGIPVCGTQGRRTNTAELTTALILALNRRLMPEVASITAGGWQTGLGRDLAGLTLGIVGLGSIGSQMATLGRAFGMEVHAWSQNLTPERCAEQNVTYAPSLSDLMSVSDVVTVHLILSERTRQLIGAEAFAAMRDDAVFVNTSRAGIVDTPALLDGLRNRKPAKAGIDVFDTEPLPAGSPFHDRTLIEEGRLLITPHLGYTTEQGFRLFYGQTVDAVRAFIKGEPIRRLA